MEGRPSQKVSSGGGIASPDEKEPKEAKTLKEGKSPKEKPFDSQT